MAPDQSFAWCDLRRASSPTIWTTWRLAICLAMQSYGWCQIASDAVAGAGLGYRSRSTWDRGPSPRVPTWPGRSRCCTAGKASPASVRPPARTRQSSILDRSEHPRRGMRAHVGRTRGQIYGMPCGRLLSPVGGAGRSHQPAWWQQPASKPKDGVYRVGTSQGLGGAPGLWQRQGMRPAARPPGRPPDASPAPPAARFASSPRKPPARHHSDLSSAPGC